MGKIIMPPKNIRYPHPKAVGPGYEIAEIIGRAMVQEDFPKWGDYMRILDLVEWKKDHHRELRFCQYYRKAKGTDTDWIFGQGAGHMKVKTFYELTCKAVTNPDYGTFEGVFDKLISKRDRRQRKTRNRPFRSGSRRGGRNLFKFFRTLSASNCLAVRNENLKLKNKR